MTKADLYFERIIEQIPHAKPGRMFGAFCMKMPNGKSAAMIWKDNIVVKLHGQALAEAMSLEGSQLFEPIKERPMNEWVQIPFKHKKRWKEFTEMSAKEVEAIEKKPSKRKKRL